MKAFIVSDIHVKNPNDQGSKFLKKFLTLCEEQEIDRIYFLGDIFDHMIGNHIQYLQKYDFFFNSIKKLITQKKEIYFFEGNHDFHLLEVFKYFLEKNDIEEKYFHYSRGFVIHDFHGSKVWLGHGDDLDYRNIAYKRWKRIYTSDQFNFLVSKFFNFNLLQKLGKWASSDSKRRGKKSFDFYSAKEKYREGARVISEKGVEYIIAGHTHIMEEFHDEYKGNKFTYINNGFPIRDGLFIYYDGNFNLQKLESFS